MTPISTTATSAYLKCDTPEFAAVEVSMFLAYHISSNATLKRMGKGNEVNRDRKLRNN
jgi:hypothetical protein